MNQFIQIKTLESVRESINSIQIGTSESVHESVGSDRDFGVGSQIN